MGPSTGDSRAESRGHDNFWTGGRLSIFKPKMVLPILLLLRVPDFPFCHQLEETPCFERAPMSRSSLPGSSSDLKATCATSHNLMTGGKSILFTILEIMQDVHIKGMKTLESCLLEKIQFSRTRPCLSPPLYTSLQYPYTEACRDPPTSATLIAHFLSECGLR